MYPDFVDPAAGKSGNQLIVYVNFAGVDLVKSADGVEQGRLTASGRSEQTYDPLIRKDHGGVVDDMDLISLALVKVLVDFFKFDHLLRLLSECFHRALGKYLT